jgi:hypothetical protein
VRRLRAGAPGSSEGVTGCRTCSPRQGPWRRQRRAFAWELMCRRPDIDLDRYQAYWWMYKVVLRQAWALGRQSRGLTWADVQAIRASKESDVALARRYRVSDGLISKIRRRQAWVTEPTGNRRRTANGHRRHVGPGRTPHQRAVRAQRRGPRLRRAPDLRPTPARRRGRTRRPRTGHQDRGGRAHRPDAARRPPAPTRPQDDLRLRSQRPSLRHAQRPAQHGRQRPAHDRRPPPSHPPTSSSANAGNGRSRAARPTLCDAPSPRSWPSFNLPPRRAMYLIGHTDPTSDARSTRRSHCFPAGGSCPPSGKKASQPDPWSELEGAETKRTRGTSSKRLKGLEPSTFCMASRRSSQLSYSRARPAV